MNQKNNSNMSLTKPIPKKLRNEMNADPFYHSCCLSGKTRAQVKIEWHHNFETYQYGNKGRLNEKWCILPVAKIFNDKANVREVRDLLNWIMLNRASDETLEKYSKCLDLKRVRDNLNKQYDKKKVRENIIKKYI